MSSKCPICERDVPDLANRERVRVECARCGTFDITDTALRDSSWIDGRADELIRRAKLSYAIRRMQSASDVPLLKIAFRDQILDNTVLPSPTDLVSNLLVIFGDELRDTPGARARFTGDEYAALIARIGATHESDVSYAANQLSELGLADNDSASGMIGGRITYNGWRYYDELKREASESHLAFMAMPFGSEKLDRVYTEYFRPAVMETGFQLLRIDEQPTAGSIDNRLRVEIRRSRFLIAELSEDNSGAYWEAGFAEGLGRPVIYTCEKGHSTHFDTRQSHTIFWTEDNLDDAAERLKDTIRATLPDEAILADPDGG